MIPLVGTNVHTRNAVIGANTMVETTLSFLSAESLFEVTLGLCQPAVIKRIGGRK